LACTAGRMYLWIACQVCWPLASRGFARDYFADYDAHLSVKSSSFELRHLVIWQEIVLPRTLEGPVTNSSLDVESAQELAAEASFRENIAMVAQDERDFLAFRLQSNKTKSKKHVLMVTHNRQQLLKGTAPGPHCIKTAPNIMRLHCSGSTCWLGASA
jgi:hypothetical protein